MLARNRSNCYIPKILTKQVRQKSVTETCNLVHLSTLDVDEKGGAEFAESVPSVLPQRRR